MSSRNRLWQSLKEKAIMIGLALLVTVGFPIITQYAGRDLESIPALVKLNEMGYYVLRLTPFVLVAFFLYNILALKRKQRNINKKISDGVTYLILPRADAPPVRGAEVTLWHRIALALPYYNHISFEVTGGENGLAYSLRTTDEDTARDILGKVMAEWPGTQMRKEDDPLRHATEAYAVEIKPLRGDQPVVASTNSPMAALLSEMAVLPKGITAGMQVQVREDPFSRLNHARRADKKTRKSPTRDMPLVNSGSAENTKYPYKPSAEESRQIQRLDLRAQEAFLEARIIIWAAAEDSKTARYTAERLAEAVSAQYHPNNKLIKGGAKRKNLMLREHPTFSGRPWVASELGTIAHLVGHDGQPPQLKKAPARPLPAMPDCRIGFDAQYPAYLKGSDPTLIIDEELPIITLDEDLELPTLTLDKDLELPTLTLDKDLELPTLTLDKDLELPTLTLDKDLELQALTLDKI